MDYTDSGFTTFLTRSIDDVPGNNLDALTDTAPRSRAVNYDASQISGALGDTLRLGSILLDGKNGRVLVSDGAKDRALIGLDNEGKFAFKVSADGHDVLTDLDKYMSVNSRFKGMKIVYNHIFRIEHVLMTYADYEAAGGANMVIPHTLYFHGLGYKPYSLVKSWLAYTNRVDGWSIVEDSGAPTYSVTTQAVSINDYIVDLTTDSEGGPTSVVAPAGYTMFQVLLFDVPYMKWGDPVGDQ